MSKRYSAFTLVEMLIVMGILIILMAVGITAGRFAINRANDVAHQNAADQIYTAMQAYYTDNREFPDISTFSDAISLQCDSSSQVCLNTYMAEGEFTGGTDATFYYWRAPGSEGSSIAEGQAVLVCVSLGGIEDESGRGFYCTGNGFGTGTGLSGITDKSVPADQGTTLAAFGVVQAWEDKAWDTN